jgi:hypothetical protein
LIGLSIGRRILSERRAAEYGHRQRATGYQISLSHFVLLEFRRESTGKTHRGNAG